MQHDRERSDDEAPGRGSRTATPPTRRELRLAEQAATSAPAVPGDPDPAVPYEPAEDPGVNGPRSPEPEPEPSETPAEHRTAAAADPLENQELPDVLPPEPDVDDVRWDEPAEGSAPDLRAGPEGADRPPGDRRSGTREGSAPAVAEDGLPTLGDLLAARPRPSAGPAETGWRGRVRRLSGGLVALPPGPAEQRHRSAVRSVQRPLDGPKTIVVLNPKGGAHKTTATMLIAATFGTYRGGYTLAWDNNETRGTLGWRSHHGDHQRTAVDLLGALHRFDSPTSARVGDLDAYVRAQPAQFDVLASDEDAASAASVDAPAFRSLHRTLSRFYRVLVVDTGNNMRASNWQAAIEAADQVVIVSTVREDTAQSAAWAVDALRATGHGDVVRNAVTVLSAPAVRRDAQLTDRLHGHFGRLTRAVLDVPYDPALVSGGPLDVETLAPATREAWLQVTAAVAEGL